MDGPCTPADVLIKCVDLLLMVLNVSRYQISMGIDNDEKNAYPPGICNSLDLTTIVITDVNYDTYIKFLLLYRAEIRCSSVCLVILVCVSECVCERVRTSAQFRSTYIYLYFILIDLQLHILYTR